MRKERICNLISIVILLVLCSVPVYAQERSAMVNTIFDIDSSSSEGEAVLVPVESEKLGSITIKLENTSENLPRGGVKFGIEKVADVVKGEFVLTKEYEGININLNEIQNANELELAAQKMKKIVNAPEIDEVTDDEGYTKITDLNTGVYLIYAENIAEYENISPFLVPVPVMNEAEGVMKYEVEVCPKHMPLETEKKPQIPQTGVDNYTIEYVGIAVISMMISMMFFGIYFNKKVSVF